MPIIYVSYIFPYVTLTPGSLPWIPSLRGVAPTADFFFVGNQTTLANPSLVRTPVPSVTFEALKRQATSVLALQTLPATLAFTPRPGSLPTVFVGSSPLDTVFASSKLVHIPSFTVRA